jgi:hypothetical protein
MKINHSRTVLARMLTGLAMLAAPDLTRAAACCQMMDGNPLVSKSDTNAAELREVIATLSVETVPSKYNSARFYYAFKVLSKAKVDTTIFANRLGTLGSAESQFKSLAYDTAGFPETHVDSGGSWGFVPGDTLRDVFLLQAVNGKGRTYWYITGYKCSYLAENNPPFPFTQAQAAFQRYADSVDPGGTGIFAKGKAKLGPVFRMTAGDAGILQTAKHDEGFWYIDRLTGSGDCPSGCTQHNETVYRINPQGSVTVVSSRDFFALCWPPESLRRPGVSAQVDPSRACYSADGRTLDEREVLRRSQGRPTKGLLHKAAPYPATR